MEVEHLEAEEPCAAQARSFKTRLRPDPPDSPVVAQLPSVLNRRLSEITPPTFELRDAEQRPFLRRACHTSPDDPRVVQTRAVARSSLSRRSRTCGSSSASSASHERTALWTEAASVAVNICS